MESTASRLLVATPALADPNFSRTVVFIVEHNADGALGVVLNRPTDVPLEDPLPEWSAIATDPGVAFLGGPVQPTALSFLHTDTFLPAANVIPNLNLGHSLDSLVEIGDSPL